MESFFLRRTGTIVEIESLSTLSTEGISKGSEDFNLNTIIKELIWKTLTLYSIPHGSWFATFLRLISWRRRSLYTSNTRSLINCLVGCIEIGQNTLGVSWIDKWFSSSWSGSLISTCSFIRFNLIPLSRVGQIITTNKWIIDTCCLKVRFESGFTRGAFTIGSIIHSTSIWKRKTRSIIEIFSFFIATNSWSTSSIFLKSRLTLSTSTSDCLRVTQSLS